MTTPLKRSLTIPSSDKDRAIPPLPLSSQAAPLNRTLSELYHKTVTANPPNQSDSHKRILPDTRQDIRELKQSERPQFRTITYSTGNKYQGEWRDGKEHGQGIFQSLDGQIYEGLWVEGRKHGEGTYTWPNGKKYKGLWVQDKMHGKGTWTDGNNTYEGEFEGGIINGFGTMTYSHGEKYEGLWVQGRKHGKGICTDGNNTYEGEFEGGIINGFGTMTYSNREKYEGFWVKGKKHGKGNWTDGNNTYEGDFKDGIMDGFGTMTYSHGEKYEGLWVQGKKHGTGKILTLRDKKGEEKEYEGLWTNNWPGDYAKNPWLFNFEPSEVLLSIHPNPLSQAIILQSTFDPIDSFHLGIGEPTLLSTAFTSVGYQTQILSFNSRIELEKNYKTSTKR